MNHKPLIPTLSYTYDIYNNRTSEEKVKYLEMDIANY